MNIIHDLYSGNQKEINSIKLSKDVCREVGYLVEKYKMNLNQQDLIKIFLSEVGNKSVVVQEKMILKFKF